MNPHFVTYFTDPYATQAECWKATLCRFTRDFTIVELPSLGTWRANCGVKPFFILGQMIAYNRPIVWVDVDATFEQNPCPLFSKYARDGVDFAAWFIENKYMQSAHVPGGPDSRNDGVASGTMFWNNTDDAFRMLHEWCLRERCQYGYEQIVLGETFYSVRGNCMERYGEPPWCVNAARLPQSHCKVFDMDWRDGSGPDPVILHHQASRQNRRKA